MDAISIKSTTAFCAAAWANAFVINEWIRGKSEWTIYIYVYRYFQHKIWSCLVNVICEFVNDQRSRESTLSCDT